MRRLSSVRFLLLPGVLLTLGGCATYDDTAMHGRCTESAHVKGMHPEAAKRESRCDGLKWEQGEREGSASPLDFSGRNKDG